MSKHTPRDLTRAQFSVALKRSGFGPEGVFGYVRLPEPYSHISVSVLNAGGYRRDQLAYLHREHARAIAKADAS
jgi:hypothetical protein